VSLVTAVLPVNSRTKTAVSGHSSSCQKWQEIKDWQDTSFCNTKEGWGKQGLAEGFAIVNRSRPLGIDKPFPVTMTAIEDNPESDVYHQIW
jgi:hypothetical protein